MLNPMVRAIVAAVILVVTVILHMDIIAALAAVLLLVSGFQWVSRRRSGAARNGTVR